MLRKGYGLGAQSMIGGGFHASFFTAAWPTGEFGGMGLEGHVRLGFRKEMEAIADPEERETYYRNKVAELYANGKAVSIASVFEIDNVIDPAETRPAGSRRACGRCQCRRRGRGKSGRASARGEGGAANLTPFVIPGRCEASNPRNLEDPGSALRAAPGRHQERCTTRPSRFPGD